MALYTGCKCPICQQPFQQNDDIVVCPECGAPYHRECYQKQGHCVFEDKHGPDFVWKPDPSAAQAAQDGGDSSRYTDPQISCPVCGAPNPATGLFCENCGSPLSGPSFQATPNSSPFGQQSFENDTPDSFDNPFDLLQNNGIPDGLKVAPQEELDGIKASDWATFLGKNAAFYLMNFKGMQITGRKIAASFAAFFFGPFYFFYRKMWALGLSIWGIEALLRIPLFLQMMVGAKHPLVQGLTLDALEPWLLITSVLNLILMFAQGMFALYLYRQHSVRRIRFILDNNASAEETSAMLAQSGGVSLLGLIISIIVTLVAIWAVSFFCLWPFLQGLR